MYPVPASRIPLVSMHLKRLGASPTTFSNNAGALGPWTARSTVVARRSVTDRPGPPASIAAMTVAELAALGITQ